MFSNHDHISGPIRDGDSALCWSRPGSALRGGDQQDGSTVIGRRSRDLHHLALRSDIDPLGRLIEDEDLGVTLQPLGDDHLLLAATREDADRSNSLTTSTTVRPRATSSTGATLARTAWKVIIVGKLCGFAMLKPARTAKIENATTTW
jgi:hypothetical protein